MHRLVWDLLYLIGKTPWNTGITPPELRAVVEGGRVTPGRALDLGCGTGTNVVYLALHGFETFGVDVSSRAISQARRKLARAQVNRRAYVFVGDVTRLDVLPITGLFDLALDVGCLHNLDAPGRERYAAGLASRMTPGGLYLLYAFGPRVIRGRQAGLTLEQAERLFAPAFELVNVTHGSERGKIASAWYTFQMSNLNSQISKG